MRDLSDLPENTRRRIENYEPQVLSAPTWGRWRESVIDAVADPKTSDEQLRKQLTFICQFVGSLDAWGFEPPFARHLTLANLERHLLSLETDGTKRTVRSAMETLGRRVNPAGGWPPVRPKLQRSPRPKPLTSVEVRAHLRSARAERSEARRRVYQVCLALGLGAGLDGRSIGRVTTGHVNVEEQGVVLQGFEALPDIPISGELGEWMTFWANRAEPGQPLCKSSSINRLVYKLVADDRKSKLSLARLRTTYLVHLIEADIPLRHLLALGGLASPSSLSEYLVYVSDLPAAQATQFAAKVRPLDGIGG